MRFPKSNAPLTVRQSLVAGSIGIVLFTLGVFLSSAYFSIIAPGMHDLASAQLDATSKQVEAHLLTLVQRVNAVSRISHQWGEAGLIDLDRIKNFNSLLHPLLEHGPDLSSLVVADQSGREVLLIQLPGGEFVDRLTYPEAKKGTATFLTWSPLGQLKNKKVEKSTYDARGRPWFKAGQKLKGDQETYWTEPFVFKSTGDPGLSAVVRWTAPDRQTYIMANDLRLLDLSRVTQGLVTGKNGFSTVLTDDGKVIGLPRDPRFQSDEQIKDAVLKTVNEVGVTPLQDGYRRWLELDKKNGKLIRFRSDGVAWVGTFNRTSFGSRFFWVGTFAPESDFLPAILPNLLWLTGLIICTLLLASLVATELARRFAGPLESLAAESARIGRMELEGPVKIQSNLREISTLALTQESMRVELMTATHRLKTAFANEQEARRNAEREVGLRDEFLALAGHELNTPITALKLQIEMLTRQITLGRDEREFLLKQMNSATMQADRVAKLVADLLDVTEITSGNLRLQKVSLQLDELVRDVIRESGLPITLKIGPAIRIEGDSARLKRVVKNLLINAAKFGAGKPVILSLSKTSEKAVLSVQDQGIGVSPENQRRIFDRYERAVSWRSIGGLGLGLFISRHIVEAHGGTIYLESKPEQGAKFTVELPLKI